MKPPIKPFLVEVKRSRSNLSRKDPVAVQQPILIEASFHSAPPPYSDVRQLAEQVFKPAAPAPASERVTFGKAEGRVLPSLEPDAAWAAAPTAIAIEEAPVAIASEAVPPKARKPRKIAAPTPRKPAASGPRSSIPKGPGRGQVAVPPAQESQPRHAAPTLSQGELFGKHMAETSAQKDLGPVSPRKTTNVSEWPAGERWKRRLRHLRSDI